MEGHRAERLTEALREELSEIIGYEMDDPRIASVHVTGVHMAPDMKHARVLVGIPGEREEQEQALRALDGARHYLRRELARRLQIYRTPELRFERDAAVQDSRIEFLLRRVKKGRPRDAASHE